ncbi:sulfite exporter TauE/SafE family protein [Georgenia sp. MJ173]|uniref:sulfite exporter TauE/SafE family protein n=1 Tax=Georgenia sunbinii TaxID=3117728 RepID=UPI002F262943
MRPLGVFAAGVGVGALSGLLGIGGGIVLVPLLVFLFHHAQKQAQATSLAAITLVSVAGAVTYGAAGDVRLLPAAFIVAGGLVGTVLGAELVHRLSERQLRWMFAALMVVVALRMALVPATDGGSAVVGLTGWVALAYGGVGLAMGVLSALVGIGGGIVVVPVLVIAFGFSPHEAQGTSLAVMAPVSLLGAWRHARHGYTDWRAGALLGAGGVLGAPLGALLALSLPGTGLQRIFAVVLVYSAIQLIRRARRP